MALKKEMQTCFGVAATYINIGKIDINYHDRVMVITALGFPTADARAINSRPIWGQDFTFAGDAFIPNADRAAIYNLLKCKPEFEGAEDV